MLNNKTSVERLFRGSQKTFENSLTGLVEPQWSQIASRVSSTTTIEDYTWLGESEELTEWVGARTVGKIELFNYSLKNLPFQVAHELSVDDVEDDRVGVIDNRSESMGRAAANWPNVQTFSALANGNASTVHGACFDGSPFFSATHPLLDGSGTFSNYTSAGGSAPWYLMDNRRTLKPLIMQIRKDPTFWADTNPESNNVLHNRRFTYGVDARGVAGYGLPQLAYRSHATLDEANFTAAKTAMKAATNDVGQPMGVNPNLLVVGVSNEDIARKLLGQEYLASGESNYLRGAIELMIVDTLP